MRPSEKENIGFEEAAAASTVKLGIVFNLEAVMSEAPIATAVPVTLFGLRASASELGLVSA